MKLAIPLFLILALTACASDSRIKVRDADRVLVNNQVVSYGFLTEFKDTTFGQYKFHAESRDGSKQLSGILPLQFNGGYLALDILFFAPAMFFNLRSVYPEYEIDIDEGLVRYRKNSEDEWIEYRPKASEKAHANAYFAKQK